MTDKTRDERLEEVGQNAYASIVEMVEALQLDWERLEELREQRDDWSLDESLPWAAACPDDAAELAELEKARGDCESEDDARQRIEEDPLSCQVRGDWHDIGGQSEDVEYCLLLGTGGPAVRIVGELGQYNTPKTARLEVQDWFTPWTEYRPADESVLLAYVACFPFDI